MEKAKSPKVGGLRVGPISSVALATPDNGLINRTGPGGSRPGGGPAGGGGGGGLAEPDKFEEPEASVTLGVRKPEHKWAQSHQAWGNSVGGDPGQGPVSSARHPELVGALKVPWSNPFTGAGSHVNALFRICLHASNDRDLTSHFRYRQIC